MSVAGRKTPRRFGAVFVRLALVAAVAGCGGKAAVTETCGPGSGSRVAYTHSGHVDFAVAGDQIVIGLLNSTVTVPLAGGDATTLAQAAPMFGGLTVAQNKVFFVGRHGSAKLAVQALFAVPLAGGQPQVVVDNVSPFTAGVLSDGEAVYLRNDQTHVLEVDAKSGATLELQLDSQLASVDMATAYDGFLYVVGSDPAKGDVGVIERIPKQGGAAQRIYSSSSGSLDLLTVGTSGLYWNEVEPGTYGSASIRHANLDGSSATTLLSDIRALALAADGGALYFSEGDRIAKLTPDGKQTTLVEGLEHPVGLQLSGHDAVWLDQVETDPSTVLIEAACVR